MQEIHSEHTFNEKKYLMMISDSIPLDNARCDICVFKSDSRACNLAYNSCKNNDSYYFVEKPNKEVEINPFFVSPKTKSDGGSSDYYKLTIRRASDGEEFKCEMGDIIYSVYGGDFDLGNIAKAMRRMYLDSKGKGKEGVDASYDAKKIQWFTDDFMKRLQKPKEIK